jgi:hypothetical protein
MRAWRLSRSPSADPRQRPFTRSPRPGGGLDSEFESSPSDVLARLGSRRDPRRCLIRWRSHATRAAGEGPCHPPPSSLDQTAGQATSEVAVLAGGCFWDVQGVYQHVKGVTGAVSGYAGGQKNTAYYETVGR